MTETFRDELWKNVRVQQGLQRKMIVTIRHLISLLVLVFATAESVLADKRPNILFCFSDDWGRYASIYQNPERPGLNDVIKTPALDKIGRGGVVFNNAFVSAPSCKPCRASVSTGMPFYRCGSNAFLHHQEYGKAEDVYKSFPGFSQLLIQGGYHVMHWGKTTNKSARRVDQTNGLPIHLLRQSPVIRMF